MNKIYTVEVSFLPRRRYGTKLFIHNSLRLEALAVLKMLKFAVQTEITCNSATFNY